MHGLNKPHNSHFHDTSYVSVHIYIRSILATYTARIDVVKLTAVHASASDAALALVRYLPAPHAVHAVAPLPE